MCIVNSRTGLIAWILELFNNLLPQQKPRARSRQLPLSPPARLPKPKPTKPELQDQGTQTQDREPNPPVNKLRVIPRVQPPERLPSLSHIRNVREGDRVLNRLRLEASIAEEKLPVVIGTLRRINPYVFEELLLICSLDQEWQIKRNFRYSGDGGVDGRVKILGKSYVFQAKRYKGYINPEHVRKFYQDIQHSKADGGFFLHTGRTGPLSRQLLQDSRVNLISGQRLVDFILGEQVRILGVTM